MLFTKYGSGKSVNLLDGVSLNPIITIAQKMQMEKQRIEEIRKEKSLAK